MGVSSREKGLLKLVHPGRHVEIHRKPVIAAEIMSKYPRHCIARPDVFKFPWIVVRPESVLLPGKVFYLVPYRTMYELLKSKGPLSLASRENKFARYHYSQHGYSPSQRNAPEQIECRNQRYDCCRGARFSCVLIQLRTYRDNPDSDDAWSDTFYVDAWTEIKDKAREVIHSYDSRVSSHDSLLSACRPFLTEGLQHCSKNPNSTLLLGHSSMHTTRAGANTELKSCFRKQDSIRKMLNLKVTFGSSVVLPNSSHETTSPMRNKGVALI